MSATRNVKWWMDDRRGELGLTWDEVANRSGVSTETLYRAGDGRPMRTTTKKGIERALLWERGSVDSILDGREPTPADSPDPDGEQKSRSKELRELRELAGVLRDYINELEDRLDGLSQPGEDHRVG